MCYIGYMDDDSSLAKKAKKNIRVWKTMQRMGADFKASFRNSYFYPNTRHQKCEQLGVEFWDNPPRIAIGEGLHAYTFRIKLTFEDVITECYIPKGSVYFADDRECVSQNLIFDKSYNSQEYLNYYSNSRFKRLFKRKPKPIYVWKD